LPSETASSVWATVPSESIRITDASRFCASILADPMGVNASLSIGKAARSTAHNSAAGAAASGPTNAGMAVGRVTSEEDQSAVNRHRGGEESLPACTGALSRQD